MRIYLIDDLGENGEYAGFLNTYRTELPPFELFVFDHYSSLKMRYRCATTRRHISRYAIRYDAYR